MVLSAVRQHNYRPVSRCAISRRKVRSAANSLISSYFYTLCGKYHYIKDVVLIDPACGSGNLLTETYISLQRLENETLSLLHKGQIMLDTGNPIQVSIRQFYGIEINDFAITEAKTELWVAESQMMKETEDVVHMSLDFLPLKSCANIVEGNALRTKWTDVIPKYELDYIMGNPSFVGAWMMGTEQKDDVNAFSLDGRTPEIWTTFPAGISGLQI